MNAYFKALTAACCITFAATASYAQVPVAASPGIASKLIVRGNASPSGELLGLQVIDLRAQPRNGMLVAQAALAIELWLSVSASRSELLAAAKAELAARGQR